MRKKNPGRFYLLTLLLAFLGAAGLNSCGDLTGKDRSTGGGTPGVLGKLYVANSDGSILAFDRALTTEGNVPPSRRFPDTLSGPTGIFLDPSDDTLYVANTNHNSILIFENASTLNPTGAAVPSRVLSGPNTGLLRPFGVVYDPTRTRLYVANRDDNSILIFQKDCPAANDFDGNIAPCRIIKGERTLLDFPRSVAIDTVKDYLYISNMGTNSILVYHQASAATTAGDIPPTRHIQPHSGPEIESRLFLPWGIAVDSAGDRLYVANTGRNLPAVLIFDRASEQSGESVPARAIISGTPPGGSFVSAQLSQPSGVFIDTDHDRLYVVNNNNTNNGSTAVVVFNKLSQSCTEAIHLCHIAPDESIVGDSTGQGDPAVDNKTALTNPSGIAYNPTKNMIFVGNTGANTLLIYAMEGNIAPVKMNNGFNVTNTQPLDNTLLEEPNGFFYDREADRLFVVNHNATNRRSSNTTTDPINAQITVFNDVRTKPWSNTAPDWIMKDVTPAVFPTPERGDFVFPRGIYIDRPNNSLIILSTQNTPRLLVYELDKIPGFPSDPSALGPAAGTVILLEDPIKTFSQDLTASQPSRGPSSMAVDQANGDVYIADVAGNTPANSKIVVYNYKTQGNGSAPARIITGNQTQLNQPYGIFFEPTRNILYVSNFGSNTVLAFDAPQGKSGNVAPNRTISSPATAAAEDKLDGPTAVHVHSESDTLYLINQNKNAIFIFDRASTRSGAVTPDRKIAGSNTRLSFVGQGLKIGALHVIRTEESETIVVGLPTDPTCVANPSTCPRGALLVFGMNGNIAPGKTFFGGSSSLAGPSTLAVDTARNILYVAAQGDPTKREDDTLSSFSEAGNPNGFGSRRTFCSPAGNPCTNPDTRLNNPTGLAIDSGQNRLYVANGGTTNCQAQTPCNAILVFFNVSESSNLGLAGRVFENPALNGPRGLAFNSGNKTLYVANTGGQSVLIFRNMESYTASGEINLDAEIGPGGALNRPIAVALDEGRDLLYVLNQGNNEVLVYENASALTSGATPKRVISGGRFLVEPSSLFLDTVNDHLYVTDRTANAVYIFENASRASGVADHKTLAGPNNGAGVDNLQNNTGLNQPIAVAVDPTR